MNDSVQPNDTQESICRSLAELPPSTAAEIAEAAGLDPDTTAAHLDNLCRRHRVMFNPLTKRYSLPKAGRFPGIAA